MTRVMIRFWLLLWPALALDVKYSVPRRLALSPALKTVHKIEALKADSLAIALRFVDIALEANVVEGFTEMTAAKLAGLQQLLTGGGGLIMPPSPVARAQLEETINRTAEFYAMLDAEVATVTWNSPSLAAVDMQKSALTKSYDKLLDLYRSHLTQIGEAEPEVEVYAYELMADTELIALHAALLLAEVSPSAQQGKVIFYEKTIEALIYGLLWGDVVHGVTELSEVCALEAMRRVSGCWLKLLAIVQPLRSDGLAAASDRSAMAYSMAHAAHELRAELDIFAVQLGEPACNPSSNMDSEEWQNGVYENNKFRELVASCTRIFLEVFQVRDKEYALLQLTQCLLDADFHISHVFKGDVISNIPTPPTQELADIYKAAYELWIIFRGDLERNARSEQLEDKIMRKITDESYHLDHYMAEAGGLYVLAARAADPSSRAIVWHSVLQNKCSLQRMTKEGLIVASMDTAVNHTGSFLAIATSFETIHIELLYGATSSIIVPGVPVPRTTDACVLTNMAKVRTDFQALKTILIQMYGAKDFLANHKVFIAEEAASPVLVDAFLAFKRGWDEFRPSDALRMQALQNAYIHGNANAVGSKDNLDFAQGPEYYHEAHRQFHPTYRAILYERNYYDIFIFDLQGNLIYSVYKELDYATNFLADGQGQWKDSGLGEAFRAGTANPDIINIIDWKPYGPSYGALASFLSTGIKQDGQLLGVFCTQLPPESRPVEVSEMELLLDKAEKSIYAAANYYLQGGGEECNTQLDAQSWEYMMEKFFRVPSLFDTCCTEFALLVRGYSQSWLSNSAQGLEEHKGFLVIEASKAELADALLAFKNAWDAYRPTDAERLLSLQIAYILLNPFPTGEKDKLDRADGPESYHTVHEKYHPTYRDILYARNYYDIFFFDLDGNLIYSVFKELDYATNFLADGPGEWKDSGLGEAFRATLSNPDGINVIDWKPYGPSYGALASFLATGVRREGALIGVFCTQLPPEFTPRNSTRRLQEAMQELSDTFYHSKFGPTPAHPPPSEWISWPLFNASDVYDERAVELSGPQTREALTQLIAVADNFDDLAWQLSAAAQLQAYEQQPSLVSEKMRLAASSLSLLTKIRRDLVLIFAGGFDYLKQGLMVHSLALQRNQVKLRDGDRQLSMSNIPPTESFQGLQLLDAIDSAWVALKPVVDAVSQGGAEGTSMSAKEVVETADKAVEAMREGTTFFSSTTRTTTMMAVEILTPVPMTGSWAAGTTFRLAVRLAEGLINEDQLLLPGYRLVHDVFDDKCDAPVASDIVVSAMALKSSYVAIGGMGCDAVCQQVSSLAVSMRLPFVSYECTSPQFSDKVAYPALARLGSVTRTAALSTIGDMKMSNGWKEIWVVSGDPAYYQMISEAYVQEFQSMGFTARAAGAYESRWNDIQDIMASIKTESVGKERVVFLLGSETFFRKLVCASLTQGLQKGIVWVSEGAWRDEWWKKTDLLTSSHRQWLREDVSGLELKQAFAAFKAAWDGYLGEGVTPNVESTRQVLFDLYVTDLKDEQYAEGPEQYHAIHAEYHPIFRQKLYDRAYYDIFFFDLNGDLIYSVFKETDYATNFQANGNGPWKDSGLGQAFRGALANPDNLTYIDWQPYGPSAFADAAFFSTGLRDEDGNLIGVYCIQLPPEYERSIEEVVPECSFETLTDAFQGAVNIAGIGRPVEADMEKPLPCFKGYSARSLLSLLDRRFESGYPVGDLTTRVEDPYFQVKANAVDAACAFAFGIQHLMRQGHTMEQIQRRDADVYQKFTEYIRTGLDFLGASGRVKFEGNDRKNLLVIQQVQGGVNMEVGMVSDNGTLSWIGNGTTSEYWQDEPADTVGLWLIHPILVTLAVLCPCLFGCALGYRIRKGMRLQEGRATQGTV